MEGSPACETGARGLAMWRDEVLSGGEANGAACDGALAARAWKRRQRRRERLGFGRSHGSGEAEKERDTRKRL